MADLRTYIAKTTNLKTTVVLEPLTDGTDRYRLRTKNTAGTTVVTHILSKAEALALREQFPVPVVTPPPPPPPPTGTPYVTYRDDSPWRTPIPVVPTLDPKSATIIAAIASSPGGKLTSDPDQYAGPIFRHSGSAPVRTIVVSGSFNIYGNGDAKPRTGSFGSWAASDSFQMPIPDSVLPSPGSDAHVILHDDVNGVEYGFWQWERDSSGIIYVTNGYQVPLKLSYGSFQDGKSGRGAGTPYGAGCFRKEDMLPDAPPHALAIALNNPAGPSGSTNFRWPASKTDGANPMTSPMPVEGARLQLDPSYDLSGLHPVARKALSWCQSHGAYVIDNSGRNKLYFEDRLTAGWDTREEDAFGNTGFGQYSVSSVPWNAWRVVAGPTKPS